MSGSVADVVAELLAVRERLAAAALIATRAGAEAEQAQSHYSEAGRGTDGGAIRAAVTNVGEAVDKSAKVARLLETARSRLAVYLNRIAPGSVPDQDVGPSAMPSGERLVTEADRRAEARRGAAGFLQRAVRDAEGWKDATKSLTELGDKGVRIFQARPAGPPAGQSTAQPTTPSVVRPEVRPKVEAPDAVSQLVILGIAAGVVTQKAEELIRRRIKRWRDRERED